jgi:hypothetical protein
VRAAAVIPLRASGKIHPPVAKMGFQAMLPHFPCGASRSFSRKERLPLGTGPPFFVDLSLRRLSGRSSLASRRRPAPPFAARPDREPRLRRMDPPAVCNQASHGQHPRKSGKRPCSGKGLGSQAS